MGNMVVYFVPFYDFTVHICVMPIKNTLHKCPNILLFSLIGWKTHSSQNSPPTVNFKSELGYGEHSRSRNWPFRDDHHPVSHSTSLIIIDIIARLVEDPSWF
jgi:hypothetical protein